MRGDERDVCLEARQVEVCICKAASRQDIRVHPVQLCSGMKAAFRLAG